MSKAEDDEIVLDEVVVDSTRVTHEGIHAKDGLKIPETSGAPTIDHPHTLASALRQIAPKIAPMFTREKLKSMFRIGKKVALGHPFFAMKGVTFSKDTKYDDDDDDDETDQTPSLLDVHDADDVKITLSTPELTETEKLLGAHPYEFIQQRTPSPAAMADSLLLQPSSRTSSWKEAHFPSLAVNIATQTDFGLVRSHSLPNISQCAAERKRLEYYLSSQLKKKLHATPAESAKKERKRHKRKKSPPPPSPHAGGHDVDFPSDEFSDISPSFPRRNTLPQITVTRCDRLSPNHLDLAVTPPSSLPSSGHSSDSGASNIQRSRHAPGDPSCLLVAYDKQRRKTRLSKESLASSECSSVSSKGTKIRTTPGGTSGLVPKSKLFPQSKTKDKTSPQTSTKPKSLSPRAKPKLQSPRTPDIPFTREQPATAPAKPSKSSGSPIFPKAKQQKSESVPGTPTSDIPSSSGIIPSRPSFPETSHGVTVSPGSPVPSTSRSSRATESAQVPPIPAPPSIPELTSVVVADPLGSSVTADNSRRERPNPPAVPPRPAPRRGSRGRK